MSDSENQTEQRVVPDEEAPPANPEVIPEKTGNATVPTTENIVHIGNINVQTMHIGNVNITIQINVILN